MPRCHTIKKSAEILYLFVGTVCATHFHKCHTKKYSEGLVWDLEMSKNGLNTDVRDCGTSGTRHTPYIYTEYIYKIIYTYFLYSVLKICPSVPQRLEMLINTGLFPWDSLSRTVPQVPHEKIFLQSYTMTGINFSCSGVLMERTILQYQ